MALTRYGALSATARALRVNHATVARRVTSLEAVLGWALFERRVDGYALTGRPCSTRQAPWTRQRYPFFGAWIQVQN